MWRVLHFRRKKNIENLCLSLSCCWSFFWSEQSFMWNTTCLLWHTPSYQPFLFTWQQGVHTLSYSFPSKHHQMCLLACQVIMEAATLQCNSIFTEVVLRCHLIVCKTDLYNINHKGFTDIFCSIVKTLTLSYFYSHFIPSDCVRALFHGALAGLRFSFRVT